MSRFAVLGSPIDHSLSPDIHLAFAQDLNIDLSFEKILTPAGTLGKTLAEFKRDGGRGACVTLPLKVEAYELCQRLSEAAKIAKAVNTLYWQDQMLCGDNTDGEGLLTYLQADLKLALANERVLILGAGGATRGIIPPLLQAGVQKIVVVNRTWAKANAFTQDKVTAFDYEQFNKSTEGRFFMVINATACSLQDTLPDLLPKWIKNTHAIDLAYKKNQQTIFQQWANDQGALDSQDGLGMLVWQAALGFKLWHHILPNANKVIDMLRSK